MHLAHAGYPVVGDEKYGDFALNKELKQRLLLHAAKLSLKHPLTGERLKLESAMPARDESLPAMKYRLIVFDWDGTIIDSAATIAECIRESARDMGLPVPSTEQASHVIGLGLHDSLRMAVPELQAEQYPQFVANYRRHFLAREDAMSLFRRDGRALDCDLKDRSPACHRHRQEPPRPGPRARRRPASARCLPPRAAPTRPIPSRIRPCSSS